MYPVQLGFGLGWPEPSIQSCRSSQALVASAKARVVTASARPRSRSAGMPTMAAASAAAVQPATTPMKKLPLASPTRTETVAPIPAKANWPRESSPATPVTSRTERPTRAYPMTLVIAEAVSLLTR